jgi:hypothetical protein
MLRFKQLIMNAPTSKIRSASMSAVWPKSRGRLPSESPEKADKAPVTVSFSDVSHLEETAFRQEFMGLANDASGNFDNSQADVKNP